MIPNIYYFKQKYATTEFNNNSVLGLLNRVVVGDFADVSEIQVTSLFSVEVCRLVSCCVYIAFCFENGRGNGG